MKVSGILCDLEGVLIKGKTMEVLPGALDLLSYCRQHELPFGIVTNNTMHAPRVLLEMLHDRGFDLEQHQLHTPLQFLSRELEGTEKAQVIGSSGLIEFVQEHEVEVVESSDVDAVILGGSYTVSNEKLYTAFTALTENDSRFFCLHRNKTFVDAAGIRRPDVGCLVAGLEYSTERSAKTLGKPAAEFFTSAMEGWQVDSSEILLISDDPVSDLPGGKSMGFQTAFVLTGKYTLDSIQALKIEPDYVCPGLDEAQKTIEELFGK